jgi:NAD(P)-dependent dehydrogenase (short-subunit alcohol dehydrogenase family)
MKGSVLITGGTGKIGTKLVQELINEEYHVYTTTRDAKKAETWILNNNIDKNKLSLIEIDFSNSNSVSIIINALNNDQIEAIIHNARNIDSLKLDTKGKLSQSQFELELYMAVVFPYLITDKLIDLNLIKRDIVFISSMYGVVAPSPSLYRNFKLESPVNYGTSKAAQIHLTKEMAVRYTAQNIRVNCVSYGGVEGRSSEDFKKRYAELNPMHRMLNETDLYPPIKMLLDNKNLSITGENIKIDGGWTIW